MFAINLGEFHALQSWLPTILAGLQKSLIALAAIFYPAPMRSTGAGWALGLGRIGGIPGPILLGGALALNWPPPTVFFAMAAPLLPGGLVILFLGARFAAVRPMAG